MISKLINFLYKFTKRGKLNKRMNDEFYDFVLRGISIEKFENNEIFLKFDTKDEYARKFVDFTKMYAQTMQDACHLNGIENYLEINFYDLSEKKFSLILVKHNGKTPHQFRLELEDKLNKINKLITDIGDYPYPMIDKSSIIRKIQNIIKSV